jgi:hypothetical protein
LPAAQTFLTYFLYIILFPFSELFRCIFFRRRRDFALASNVSIFMVVYWVYVICTARSAHCGDRGER